MKLVECEMLLPIVLSCTCLVNAIFSSPSFLGKQLEQQPVVLAPVGSKEELGDSVSAADENDYIMGALIDGKDKASRILDSMRTPGMKAKPMVTASTVLVTGGAGYIGSHAVVKLLENGHKVIVVDNLSRSQAAVVQTLEEVAKHEFLQRHYRSPRKEEQPFDFAKIDLHDTVALTNVLLDKQPDVVMHFAGVAFVSESQANPLKYYENITSDTVSLLESMTAAGVTRLIYASSCATYGNAEHLPITEDTPQLPISPYGRAKAFAEDIIKDWAHATPGARAGILRFFNVFGSDPKLRVGEVPTSRDPKTARLMHMLFESVENKREFQIFGDQFQTSDGFAERDFVHVNDVVSAHLLLMDSFKGSTTVATATVQIYNLGTGTPTSVMQMVKMVERAANQSIPFVIKPSRPGDAARVFADSSKISNILGWKPVFSRDLESAVRAAWEFHLSHIGGYGGKDQLSALWLQPRFDLLQAQGQIPKRLHSNGSLILGILTAPGWAAQRMQHRRTWMQQECVSIESQNKTGVVVPRFVVEKSSMKALAQEQASFGDLVFVDDVELRMKPLTWMQKATALFPDAQYIGKMDADTYIASCALISDLSIQKAPFFYGHEIDANVWVKKSTEASWPTIDAYMQGGLYVLSADLARWLRKDPFAYRHPPNSYNFEDYFMASWVGQAKKQLTNLALVKRSWNFGGWARTPKPAWDKVFFHLYTSARTEQKWGLCDVCWGNCSGSDTKCID